MKKPKQSAATALIPHRGGSLLLTGRCARVVSRMTAGVLEAMRRGHHLASADRHRIGDVELDAEIERLDGEAAALET